MEEDGPASGAVNGSAASTRGFLAEDGLRYLTNIAGDGSTSTFTSQRKLRYISQQWSSYCLCWLCTGIWLPRLHPLPKTEEKGKKDAVRRAGSRRVFPEVQHVVSNSIAARPRLSPPPSVVYMPCLTFRCRLCVCYPSVSPSMAPAGRVCERARDGTARAAGGHAAADTDTNGGGSLAPHRGTPMH